MSACWPKNEDDLKFDDAKEEDKKYGKLQINYGIELIAILTSRKEINNLKTRP